MWNFVHAPLKNPWVPQNVTNVFILFCGMTQATFILDYLSSEFSKKKKICIKKLGFIFVIVGMLI